MFADARGDGAVGPAAGPRLQESPGVQRREQAADEEDLGEGCPLQVQGEVHATAGEHSMGKVAPNWC